MEPPVVESILTARNTGATKAAAFMQKQVRTQAISFWTPIGNSRLLLFRRRSHAQAQKCSKRINTLKENCEMFSQLFAAVACKREVDTKNFIAHESSEHPPSISKGGCIRVATNKALLLQSLESFGTTISHRPKVDALFVDGAILPHLLPPTTSLNFNDLRAKS